MPDILMFKLGKDNRLSKLDGVCYSIRRVSVWWGHQNVQDEVTTPVPFDDYLFLFTKKDTNPVLSSAEGITKKNKKLLVLRSVIIVSIITCYL